MLLAINPREEIVAQNPNTPQYIRDKLKEDINRIVRAAAHGQSIVATLSG